MKSKKNIIKGYVDLKNNSNICEKTDDSSPIVSSPKSERKLPVRRTDIRKSWNSNYEYISKKLTLN
eukprot:TRINITY_DN4015_c0_g1_i1.p1 TRINITY_DN4015_c0_g1~~TRINITY_DN4015_c0_g1_i1.p1  ORF type:complete len:66 (-),score=9.94 TRINITY_DN4015_c0_g1_i1:233-430(-)